jgi:hypothetical protein
MCIESIPDLTVFLQQLIKKERLILPCLLFTPSRKATFYVCFQTFEWADVLEFVYKHFLQTY